jgi:hypothetical protein
MPDRYDDITMVLAAFAGAMFGLSALARRFPQVAWLRHFRRLFPRLGEAERAKLRRRSNVYAGAQLILMGVALPLGYGALTMMTFGSFGRTEVAWVLGASALCIALGVTALWRNRAG